MADQPNRDDPGPPLAGWILFGFGATLLVINLLGLIAEPGSFLFAPGLGFFSIIFFVVGAISAGADLREGAPRAGTVINLCVLGTLASIVVSCAGLPKQ